MNTFHIGQLVTLKNNEDAGQLLVMLITNDAKPIKCLPLDDAFNTHGFQDFKAYSADELEHFDSEKPYFLADNKLRDLQERVLPLYRTLLTYPIQQQPQLFSVVLTETAKHISQADKIQLNEAQAQTQNKAEPQREAVLHFLGDPRVELRSKAIMGYFMQDVHKYHTT